MPCVHQILNSCTAYISVVAAVVKPHVCPRRWPLQSTRWPLQRDWPLSTLGGDWNGLPFNLMLPFATLNHPFKTQKHSTSLNYIKGIVHLQEHFLLLLQVWAKNKEFGNTTAPFWSRYIDSNLQENQLSTGTICQLACYQRYVEPRQSMRPRHGEPPPLGNSKTTSRIYHLVMIWWGMIWSCHFFDTFESRPIRLMFVVIVFFRVFGYISVCLTCSFFGCFSYFQFVSCQVSGTS